MEADRRVPQVGARKCLRALGVIGAAAALVAVMVPASGASTVRVGNLSSHRVGGYWVVTARGAVGSYGAAKWYGSAARYSAPIVGMASAPGLAGYWVVGADGKVSSFGKAAYFGSVHRRLAEPVVGMTATLSGKGYWVVARDGGVFAFGQARFAGSAARARHRAPMEGISATPDGRGYWLVARDGGVFSFGDARFFGSAAHGRLRSPVVGIASTRDGRGYWVVAADGHVSAFGDAPNFGSAALAPGNRAVAIAPAPGGSGYVLATQRGAVLGFGDARWATTRLGPVAKQRDVVALAASSPGRYTRALRTGARPTTSTSPQGSQTPPATLATPAPSPVPGTPLGTAPVSPTLAPTTTTSLGPTTTTGPMTTVAPTTTSSLALTTTTSTGGTSCTHPVFGTSSPSGIWYDAPYYVFNNMWNDTNPPASGPGTQSLNACSHSNWYVVSDQPAPGQPANSVKTYPNVQENFSSIPVSQFSQLSSTFSETDPHVGDYEDAYDIWLNGIANSTSNEVMIWNENYGQTPAGSDVGSVTLDGHSWAVYTTSSHSYTAFVASANFTSGTLDLLGFFKYLIGRGLLPGSTVVDQVDYGVEICSTGAEPATFSFNDFSIDATYS
jgi:hypothetical protein